MEISGADNGSDIELEEESGFALSVAGDKSDKSSLIADAAEDDSDGLESAALCCANWREYSISLFSFSCSFMDNI